MVMTSQAPPEDGFGRVTGAGTVVLAVQDLYDAAFGDGRGFFGKQAGDGYVDLGRRPAAAGRIKRHVDRRILAGCARLPRCRLSRAPGLGGDFISPNHRGRPPGRYLRVTTLAGCAQRCRQHYQEGDTRTLECPHSLSPYVPGQPTGVVPFQFDCPAEGAPPPEPSLATWTGLPLTQGTPFRDQSPSAAVGPVLVVIGFNPTQFPSYGTLRNRKRRTHLPR